MATTAHDKPLPYYQTDPTQPIDLITYTPTYEATRATLPERTIQRKPHTGADAQITP